MYIQPTTAYGSLIPDSKVIPCQVQIQMLPYDDSG